ncbi:Hypp9073 [Branchiostoma lanceolatum]|uniref:Hypp9073 protein n=1 Tax=Branchiostoma lanceolatum TaxID=7740 RepID=A0A8J9ZBH9_BRALA|nr:Hypp9073 [Branchiostoma lanceolatum]
MVSFEFLDTKGLIGQGRPQRVPGRLDAPSGEREKTPRHLTGTGVWRELTLPLPARRSWYIPFSGPGWLQRRSGYRRDGHRLVPTADCGASRPYPAWNNYRIASQLLAEDALEFPRAYQRGIALRNLPGLLDENNRNGQEIVLVSRLPGLAERKTGKSAFCFVKAMGTLWDATRINLAIFLLLVVHANAQFSRKKSSSCDCPEVSALPLSANQKSRQLPLATSKYPEGGRE